MQKFQILDCTIRDGGYYTNWDFSDKLVVTYLEAMDKLPVDFIEIGYRNKKHKEYRGEFFYCPASTILKVQKITSKPIVIILNERDLKTNEIEDLLRPCLNKISMVRMAIDPKNITRAKKKAVLIKKMGFTVAFNIMYLSNWINNRDFLKHINNIENYVDYFYMVDSFGSVFPKDLEKLILEIKKITNVKLGFHGHNNLELALANTIIAINNGISIVDSTILGMGRGSGNLKTELLLSIFSKETQINFDVLSRVLEFFYQLKKKENWGTNLAYMIAGVESIPQKKIMDWIGNKFYSLNSIVSALNSSIQSTKTNNFKSLVCKENSGAIIVGGGNSIIEHFQAIQTYININRNKLLIFSSTRYLKLFESFENEIFICLVGNENERLTKAQVTLKSNMNFVLPPEPRELGTFIPKDLKSNIFEIKKSEFEKNIAASHCSTAIESILSLKIKKAELIGFDGYLSKKKSSKEDLLFNENEFIFKKAKQFGLKLVSLTPTLYNNLTSDSIYSRIDY